MRLGLHAVGSVRERRERQIATVGRTAGTGGISSSSDRAGTAGIARTPDFLCAVMPSKLGGAYVAADFSHGLLDFCTSPLGVQDQRRPFGCVVDR
jgi:hypothetical protein